MDRSSGGGASTYQLAALASTAAIFGLAAGAAVVYLTTRSSWAPKAEQPETQSRVKPLPSRTASADVPLFDSVTGWLRQNSSGGSNPMESRPGIASRQSGRSNTLSAPPPPVPEEDETEAGSQQAQAAASTRTRSRAWGQDGREGLPSDWEIQESEIEICKRSDGGLWHLGAGSYGQVFKALRGGVQPCAVKVFPSDATDVQMADFQKEVVILKSCRDRNIVQFLGACITETQTCLVTEFMENGDLYNALHRSTDGSLTWYKRSQDATPITRVGQPVAGMGKQIALDVARGLHFLHTHRIVHMDVKSPNILLGLNHCAKLADVGLAKFMKKDYLSAAKSVGTFAWSAPEVLLGARCSEKVDIFSYGVVLWEIVTGESPARGRLRPVRVPQECPESIAELIQCCMDAEPAERPTARELVELLSQQVDKPLRPSTSRRTRSAGVLDSTSGRVLDDLIRHAHVIGLKDYSRADALLAAQYKDELHLYKAYLAALREVMPDVAAPPAKGTPQHARLLEVVASFRALLCIFLAENNDTLRQLRNVDMNKAERKSVPAADGDSAAAITSQGDGESMYGKREEAVDWRAAVTAMQITPQQAAAICDARATVVVKLEELIAGRRKLISSLQDFASSGRDDGYSSAVGTTEELRRNMAQEGVILHEFHFWFFANALQPVQEAAVELASCPFFPDPLQLSDIIVRDAVHAMASASMASS